MSYSLTSMIRRAAQAKTQRAAPKKTWAIAKYGATRLTPAELEHYIRPGREAVEAFRVARSTYAHWLRLCTMVNTGQAIESQGIVRGLAAELDAAHDALQAIGDRMDTPDGWKPGALRAEELHAIQRLVAHHAFQLRNLSRAEHARAYELALARVRSAGGQAVNIKALEAA